MLTYVPLRLLPETSAATDPEVSCNGQYQEGLIAKTVERYDALDIWFDSDFNQLIKMAVWNFFFSQFSATLLVGAKLADQRTFMYLVDVAGAFHAPSFLPKHKIASASCCSHASP